MLSPIVSMNRMAMNESVAMTCCYRDVVTPTAVYWEVLHGGWIGSGYAEGWVKNPDYLDLDDSWLAYKYDLIFMEAGNLAGGGSLGLGAATPSKLMKERLGYGEYVNSSSILEKNWYVFDTQSLWTGPVSLGEFLATYVIPIRPGGTCDHKTDPNCVYGSFEKAFVTDYHFEAKTAHDVAAGFNWKDPHPAQKYSS